MDLKENLGVFVCPHVFEDTRPILLVIHEEGDWQCLCGFGDHDEKGHLVGMGHLAERDPSILDLSDLPDGWEAERKNVNEPWIRTRCEYDD